MRKASTQIDNIRQNDKQLKTEFFKWQVCKIITRMVLPFPTTETRT